MSQHCPLCNSTAKLFYNGKHQTYYQCDTCFGIFLLRDSRPSRQIEITHYRQHNNDVEDKGYQTFVSPITEAILHDFNANDKGLDFGAGTGPVISKMLTDHGFSIAQYDPYFHNYPELLKQQYDYIASCEVIEHFFDPRKEFTLLKSLLKPQGKLFCMTHIYDESIDFASWYYKNDPTHVFIYHANTIGWIKKEFAFSDVMIANRLIVFST